MIAATSEEKSGTVEVLAYRQEEARKALGGISRTTFWRLEQTGRISPIKGSRPKLYAVEMLKNYVRSGYGCGA